MGGGNGVAMETDNKLVANICTMYDNNKLMLWAPDVVATKFVHYTYYVSEVLPRTWQPSENTD